jgi:hypothetical protein
MPAKLAGTVSWTMTPANSASFIGGVGADANFRIGRFCVNPGGTFLYGHCKNGTGKLLRIDLAGANAGKGTMLYTNSGLATGATVIATTVREDGLTLDVVRVASNVYRVYSVAADGSTGGGNSNFAESAAPTSGGVSGQLQMQKSPHENRLYMCNGGGERDLLFTVPGTWANMTLAAGGSLWKTPGDTRVLAIGFHLTNAALVYYSVITSGASLNGVFEWNRTTGRVRCVVGSQAGGSGGTGANPYLVPAGACVDAWGCSDGAGGDLVYYADPSLNVRCREANGTVSQIVGNYVASAGMVPHPDGTAAYVASDTQIAKVV